MLMIVRSGQDDGFGFSPDHCQPLHRVSWHASPSGTFHPPDTCRIRPIHWEPGSSLSKLGKLVSVVMVGVAHSRACTECRRKRKGCDGQRPACGLCAKFKRTCTYLNRPWLVVKGAESSSDQGITGSVMRVRNSSNTRLPGRLTVTR